MKTALFTAYRLGGGLPYGQVPPLRVLLFTVHEEFHCLRLQLYVSDTLTVVHCRHRFTTDPRRQPFLNPAALSWRQQALHAVNYAVEYARDPEAYIAEAERHGFTRAKVANIVVHIASSVSMPLPRLVVSPDGAALPAVICIDSERADVFPPAVHGVLQDVVHGIVDDHNTGRRRAGMLESRDFVPDNRGIIDEVGDEEPAEG